MKIKVEKNVPLADYTTLKVGGTARYFSVLNDVAALPLLVDYAISKNVPIWILGGGSNVLIDSGELSRLVIKNELKGVSFVTLEDGDTLVTASAGEEWDVVVKMTVDEGLAGLENLSGVPGTVGAAPIQNINCYGVSVSEVIESVEVFDAASKQMKKLNAEECEFGYRDSLFKRPAGANLIVTAVTFRLSPAGTSNLSYRSASQSIERYLSEQGIKEPTVSDVRQAILHVRSNIGMIAGDYRSAGSFFKNTIVSAEEFKKIKGIVNEKFADLNEKFTPWHWPLPDGSVKISTAFFFECTPYNKSTYGSKRWRDVVGISPLHTLSIVTEEGATAKDVIDFVALITKEVEDTFGVILESEVNHIFSDK